MPVFVWVAAAVAVFLLAEGALRFYHRYFSREYFFVPKRRMLFHVHPEISPTLPSRAEFRTNSLGERGDEPPLSTRLYRGLVIGGSAAECSLLDHEQTWPVQIQRCLEKAVSAGRLDAGPVYVGNIGRSGMDAKAINIAVKRLFTGQPKLDFIVVHSGPSDFTRWIEHAAPPDGRFPDMPVTDVLHVCRLHQFGFSPGSTALAYYARSAAAALVGGRVTERPIGRYVVTAREKWRSTKPHRALPSDPQPFFDEFHRNSIDLLETCKSVARHVIVLPQLWLDPSVPPDETDRMFWFGRFARHAGKAEQDWEFLDHSEIIRLFEGVYKAAVDTAAQCGVHALPLRGKFAQDSTNFYDDDHFTPHGSASTARLIADLIVDIESAGSARS